ncbi:hemerythrin domain-containing protein [Planotetraspora kaengkrachanensis]|nr:hemerythrin domain-containing protein [Planotetraspora kaengkrachanensis]
MAIEQVPMADIRDMYMAHILMRREFGLAPAVVRAVDEGDVSRADLVADHIELISDLVHSHHAAEDALLWPKLLDRGSEEVADIVHLMEGHHEAIDAAYQEVRREVGLWRATAGVVHRDALADALEKLNVVLVEHTALEEQHILPLAEKYITAAEWQELGTHAMAGVPKKKLPLAFGMAMYEGDPEVIKEVLSFAPLMARLTMPFVGPRVYASYARRLYGTATPPRSAA